MLSRSFVGISKSRPISLFLEENERKGAREWAPLVSIRKIYTILLFYTQYFYTRLDIRRASVFTIIPNFSDIQLGPENYINIITNIIFYGTFFFILYKIKKNFATLAYIGTDSPIQKNSILFNIAKDYFNIVYYTMFLFISILFLWDFTYLVCGGSLVRPPLHYTRLLKMFIAFVLYMVNIAIKKLRSEKLTIWDFWKIILLFTPIIIQIFMTYGLFTSLINILMTLVASLSHWCNEFYSNNLKDWIKRFVPSKIPQMMGDDPGNTNPNKNCIEKPKADNMNARRNNTGNSQIPGSNNRNGNGNGNGNGNSSDSSDSDTPRSRTIEIPTLVQVRVLNPVTNNEELRFRINLREVVVQMTSRQIREYRIQEDIRLRRLLATADQVILRAEARRAELIAMDRAQVAEIASLRAQIAELESIERNRLPEAEAQQEQSGPVRNPDIRGRPSTSADQTSSTLGQGTQLNPRPATAPESRTPTTRENENRPNGWFSRFISRFKKGGN